MSCGRECQPKGRLFQTEVPTIEKVVQTCGTTVTSGGRAHRIPVRYGVRTETLLNGTYSDYVREFNKIPTVTHQMPNYAPQAVAPAYSYIHPHYLYDQQMQQSYGVPAAMTAAGYMPNYADRPVADHHHYNYNQYGGSDYSRNDSSRDYYRQQDYRRDHYADHR